MPDSRGFPFRQCCVHVACWLLLIAYELGMLHFGYGKMEALYIYAAFYALNIGYFYGLIAVLDWSAARIGKRLIPGLLLWVALLLANLLLKRLLDHVFYASPSHKNPLEVLRALLPAYLFRTMYFTVLAAFYWAAGHIGRYKNRQLVSEREKAEIRNAYLQQQISPHMLFNTLNLIYSDVYQRSPEAGRSVLLLSDILRFSLDAAGPDGKTGVAQELVHLGQLIEINRYRFEVLYLELILEGDPGLLRIIPLVMLTLTENVFKHGWVSEASKPALIRVFLEPSGRLSFYSRNFKKSKSEFARAGGLGLHNIRMRLDHSYPGAYELEVSQDDDIFELNLTIQL